MGIEILKLLDKYLKINLFFQVSLMDSHSLLVHSGQRSIQGQITKRSVGNGRSKGRRRRRNPNDDRFPGVDAHVGDIIEITAGEKLGI